ncbi:hypothetical protein BCR43DRAFT_49655 [Syncephalastrum racemosum]|uniref:Uncharacterized protein n=1 Tax=Syncephalastrum racemosum TaxID=13706 RepID=A0A1X2HV12_SYNRA|nr:hypothetical protein BCR43DRAFT_49655 [Syncephalastrum racemosum]
MVLRGLSRHPFCSIFLSGCHYSTHDQLRGRFYLILSANCVTSYRAMLSSGPATVVTRPSKRSSAWRSCYYICL